jgi:hypothetical protein
VTLHVSSAVAPPTPTAQCVLRPTCSPEPPATQDVPMVATSEVENVTPANPSAASAHHPPSANNASMDTSSTRPAALEHALMASTETKTHGLALNAPPDVEPAQSQDHASPARRVSSSTKDNVFLPALLENTPTVQLANTAPTPVPPATTTLLV